MVEAELLTRGWHLSKEGIERCKNGASSISVDILTKAALDIDLKQIGSNALPADIGKGKSDKIQGPYVLQIQKVRNIAAPKSNEESSVAPNLLRLQLTDGHTTCLGMAMETVPQIGLNTPPGTKVLLKGSVDITTGFLMFTQASLKVLGGRVEDMVERWELAKKLAHHTRTTLVGEGAPPPWVAFGQRHRVQNSGSNRQTIEGPGKKRTLNLEKNREQTEQDREFEEQRKAAIKELDQARGQQGGKKFGGTGKGGGQDASESKENYPGSRSNQGDRRGQNSNSRTLSESVRNSQAAANYRDPSFDKRPDERSVSQLVTMGFLRDDAVAALKKHSGNFEAAVESLVTSSSSSKAPSVGSGGIITNSKSQSGPPQRGGRDRPERGSGFKGRRGRRGENEDDEEAPSQPSAPTTLFDFLESKLGPSKAEALKPKENDPQNRREKNENRNEAPNRYEREQAKTGRDAGRYSQRETPPRFQKLQAQKQAQRQQSDGQPGMREGGRREGGRRERPARFEREEQRREGKKSNEWTNAADESSKQGFRGESSRYSKSDRGQDGGYQDRGDNQSDGFGRRGNKSDGYQNDRGYQGREKQGKPERFQQQDRRGDRNGQSERYGNDRDGYQGRSSGRRGQFDDRSGKSTDSNRYNSKNDAAPEKTYRLMERKVDGRGSQNQEGSVFSRSSGDRREDAQDGTSNWKGSVEDERQTNNIKIMPKSEFQSYQQGKTFIPQHQQQQQQQQQQVVSDNGRGMAENSSQSLNQQPLGAGKVVSNGPEAMSQLSGSPMLPFKKGDHCFAKYWEDKKFYKAQITGIHQSGKTCMVKFVEYGNFEEVFVTDIMPSPDHPWTAPPPPIQPVQPQLQPAQQPQQQQQQQPQQQQQQQFMAAGLAYAQPYQQAPPPHPTQLVTGQASMLPQEYSSYDSGALGMSIEFRKGGDGAFVQTAARQPAQVQGQTQLPQQQGLGQEPGGGFRGERQHQRAAQNFYQPPPRR